MLVNERRKIAALLAAQRLRQSMDTGNTSMTAADQLWRRPSLVRRRAATYVQNPDGTPPAICR